MKKILLIFPIILVVACSPKNESNEGSNQADTSTVSGIYFTQEQLEKANILTQKPEIRKISEIITSTGRVEASPSNIASVSPVIGGFIKSINYSVGDYVEKGAVLASLQHSDFIDMQQQYSEAKSQKEYYEQEYKRQGELTVENAASLKNMQKAKADFLSAEAKYKSLKAQLNLVGVNTEKIEKGEFLHEFYLIAPISGYVSNMNANTGKYSDAESVVYQIINNKTLNIYLNIFEKDISKINVGQKIVFTAFNGNFHAESTVKQIGVSINETDHTTAIQGVVDNKNNQFKSGMFVNAKIYVKEHMALVVPVSAVIETETESFIFFKEGQIFQKVIIEKGIEQDGFCEIVNPDNKLKDADVVIQGNYYLLSFAELNE